MFIHLWSHLLQNINIYQIRQFKNISTLLIYENITLMNFLFAWSQNLINLIHIESCLCTWAKSVCSFISISLVFQVCVSERCSLHCCGGCLCGDVHCEKLYLYSIIFVTDVWRNFVLGEGKLPYSVQVLGLWWLWSFERLDTLEVAWRNWSCFYEETLSDRTLKFVRVV